MSNDCETSFWKVIHNKYLFNHIFEIIHTTEWNEYEQVKQIHIDNRIRFKHLNNLRFFLVNNQFQLLKCKLEAGEHIEILKYDLSQMLETISLDGNGNGGQEKEEREYNIKESLKLLFKYKSFQLSEFDITSLTGGYSYGVGINLKLVSFLSECSTSMVTIYPSALKLVMENSDTKLLDVLFSLPNINVIVSQETKDNSISYAFNNIKHREEILEYILNGNGKLYSVPWIPTSSSTTDTEPSSSLIKKIDLISIFSLKSTTIQNQLIELNYFNVHPFIDELETNEILMDVNIVDKTKKIHRLIALLDESYYASYLVNYNGEEINGVNVDQVKLQSDINLLKYKQTTTNIGFFKYFSLGTVKSQTSFITGRDLSLESILLFISAYTSPLNQLVNSQTDREIIRFITFSLKNKQDFDNALESIAPTSDLLNQLPKSWNTLMLIQSDIKDIETIDWVYDNIQVDEFWSKSYNRKQITLKYQTSELMYYAQNKFKSHPYLSFSPNYSRPFIYAISNCNIQELQHILDVSSVEDPDDNETFTSFKPITFNENCRSSDILQLLSFLNKIGYRKFDNRLFLEFVNAILKFKFMKDTNVEIGIEFGTFASRALCLNIVSTFKPIAMKLLFRDDKNNLIKRYPQSLNSAMQDHVFISSFSRSKVNYKCAIIPYETDLNIDDVIQSIELTIDQFNKISKQQQQQSTEDKTYCLTLENLIGYQFSKLIKINFNESSSSLVKLQRIYQKIVQNEIPIQLKQYKYHSIFYLGLKSPKLLKYILQYPFAVSPYVHGYGHYCIDQATDAFPCYDIKKYFDETIFSFDYIFNSGATFDLILEKLIHRLSHLPGKVDQEMVINEKNGKNRLNYYDKSFNYNLVYLLEINRHDLFFKELEFINKFELTVPMTEHSFKLMNFKLSSKLIKFSSRVFEVSQFRSLITLNSSRSFILYMEKNRFTPKKLLSDFEYSEKTKPLEKSIKIVDSLLNQVETINQVLSLNGRPMFWGEHFINDSTLLNHKHYLLQYIKFYPVVPNVSILSHELLLNSNPDYSKISKDSIKTAISIGKIGFLKFYFENGIINDNDDDKLLTFLKYQLLSHSDYKYINWLN